MRSRRLRRPFRLLAVLPGDVPRDVVLSRSAIFFCCCVELSLLRESAVRRAVRRTTRSCRCTPSAVSPSKCSTWSTTAARNARSWLISSTVALARAQIFLEPAASSRGPGGSSARRAAARRRALTSWRAKPRRPRSPPLSLPSRLRPRVRRVEPETVQHCVDARRDRVAALALEALEVMRRIVRHRGFARVDALRFAPARSSDRSSASSSSNGPGRRLPYRAASPKSRCCSSSVIRVRAAARTGRASASSSPVMRRNSVVFPVPFRPTIPHRSPVATVNVMSVNSVVAPNSTATPDRAICVTCVVQRLPVLLRRDRSSARSIAYQWHREEAMARRRASRANARP